MKDCLFRCIAIWPLAFFSGYLLPGCGSDPGAPMASDFEGLWLITSVTAQVGTSTQTVQRDGAPLAVWGDVVFTPVTESTGVVSIRQVLLEDNVPQGPLISREDEVVLDGQQWVLTEETGDVSVYTAVLNGDNLSLTWNPSDSRNMRTAPPPEEILAMRAPAWPVTTVGNWKRSRDCDSMLIPSDPPIFVTIRFEARLSISSRHVAEVNFSFAIHENSDCSDPVAPATPTQFGLLEEDDGKLLGWWVTGAEPRALRAKFEELRFSIAGDELSTTPIDCEPWPDCLAFPTRLIFNGVWQRSP
jgi:hypothetical protein